MILMNNCPFLGQNSRQKQLEEHRKDNYSRIYTHEEAGSFSTPILIECTNEASSGRHVNITIPVSNKDASIKGSNLDIEG